MVPKTVLEAFNINEDGVPLQGGQSTSKRYGDVVIKPVEESQYSEFSAQVFDQLKPDGYRISKPIRSNRGCFVVDGFAANRYEPGEHDFSRVEDTLVVSTRLHHDLKNQWHHKVPIFTNHWAKAQQILWSGKNIPGNWPTATKTFLQSLLLELVPLQLDSQLIHSDLGGNVLFHPQLEPLVIDFSPAYAPVEYANAIIVCDGIAWEGLDFSAIELLQPFDGYREVIKYAILFRVLTTAFFNAQNINGIKNEWDGYKQIWAYVSPNSPT